MCKEKEGSESDWNKTEAKEFLCCWKSFRYSEREVEKGAVDALEAAIDMR